MASSAPQAAASGFIFKAHAVLGLGPLAAGTRGAAA